MAIQPRKVFIQLAFPIVAIVVGVIMTRSRGYAFQDDLKLVWPSWVQLVIWLPAWIVWIAASEIISRRLKMPQPTRWEPSPPWLLAIRVLTLALLSPIAEEFIFRGLLYYRISTTSLGAPGAILIAAAIFSVIHLQYRREQLALIFLDGMILGLALYISDSLLLPMTMHIIGNTYAVLQRLPARPPATQHVGTETK